MKSRIKIMRVGLIAKEGHGEAKQVAADVAKLLLARGFEVVSFPNLRTKPVEHVSNVKELKKAKVDLFITVSGDGTILRLLRILDSTVPFLCVNVGGRGILSEIKPGQMEMALDKIQSGEINLERRLRIRAAIGDSYLPPALNEVYVMRQSETRTPIFTVEFAKGAVFSQRMDGLIITSPTGSTGHSYSYGAPFLEGNLDAFAVTPVGPIKSFPTVIKTATEVRLTANYSLKLVIDGQESFNVESDTYVAFKKHDRDAFFIRLDTAGPYRQLKNLGFE